MNVSRHTTSRRSSSPSRSARSRMEQRVARSRSTQGAERLPSSEQPNRTLKATTVFTKKAIALIVVIFLIIVSYWATLQVYINQQREMGQLNDQIAAHKSAISDLENQVGRWKDDEFDKTQARERLGWVMPGERGYRVMNDDGTPFAGGQQILEDDIPTGNEKTWWDRLWSSVQAADNPNTLRQDDSDPIKRISFNDFHSSDGEGER